MEKGKVSIIVPIYNVEKYLERCLMSLVSQTYTDIEILLINDGSTDHSGEICRNFADHYPQIRYFEKENEGPSIARNFGIQKAVGEFLSFVDSDDYIEQEMIERMLLCAQRENAQLVMCSYRIDYRFGVLYRKAPKYKVWKKEEALHALLRNDSVNNFAWGKLFRRDLFDGLLFPACRFEDVFTIFQTFLKAETIVTMPERFYHYFQRKGSIMNKDGLLALDMDIVLEMRDISKNFTGVRALSHVDFTLRKGEIHALMGENGAGKSTLIKVLTGVHEFESGSIHMNGENKEIINHSPQEAQANGISTVYQEVNLCPNLTVAENLFIGREPRNKLGMINWKEMNARSAKLLESLNINVPPTQMLDECSVAIQQMIAIARAVDMKCKVLILDEPTSSLDDEEVEKLFVLMRRLREEGVGIVFVTHFLEQVYAVCDRITVLRNGELVGEYETKDLPRVMLVAKMMGKDFDDLADIKGDHKDKKAFSDTPVIEASGLGHKGTIKPFDLKINKGEVIGLTGLLGSGRSELVRSIYGADKADSGTLKVNGKEAKIGSPLDAMKLGMAYLPEDRKAEGIIADLSVRENIIIALQAKKGMFHPLSRKEMEEAADKYIEMLQIKTANRETPIKSLSGGNQQKVILGRWLLTNPEYLILDEPTRGIDIGTKTEIQKIVLDLADQGMAVTFISSEVEEMLRTCSRMAVLRDGEKVGELEESELSQANIMKAIAGGDEK